VIPSIPPLPLDKKYANSELVALSAIYFDWAYDGIAIGENEKIVFLKGSFE